MNEFPRFTRKQKLSCKLSDEDILEIQHLRKEGITYKEIAGKFKINKSTITYWINSPEKRKLLTRIKNQEKGKYKRILETRRKYRLRKKELYPEEFMSYEHNSRKETTKRYYLKNRDKILEKCKEYQKNHPEVRKKSLKKYREKLLSTKIKEK